MLSYGNLSRVHTGPAATLARLDFPLHWASHPKGATILYEHPLIFVVLLDLPSPEPTQRRN